MMLYKCNKCGSKYENELPSGGRCLKCGTVSAFSSTRISSSIPVKLKAHGHVLNERNPAPHRQRFALIIGGLTLAITALFPPFLQQVRQEKIHIDISEGYYFILSSQKPGIVIDMGRWVVPMIVVIILTGIAFYLARGDSKG